MSDYAQLTGLRPLARAFSGKGVSGDVADDEGGDAGENPMGPGHISISDGVEPDGEETTTAIPAQAGIQLFQYVLNPGLCRGDEFEAFYETVNKSFNA